MGKSPYLKRIYISLIVLSSIILVGTAGYMWIEKLPFLDALYMTVITITTVGFGEVTPLSSQGRIFTMGIILLGTGTMAYMAVSLAEFVIAGHLVGLVGRRRMEKKISQLHNHYIVCGFGRVGQEVVRELQAEGADFVVIDSDEKAIERCEEPGILNIGGDASDDEILLKAGIMKAKGLVTAVDSDPENVYITLSARVLRPDIYIVARSNTSETDAKLCRAGANRIVNPGSIGGRRMAAMLLRPSVSDFLDIITQSDDLRVRLKEIKVGEKSALGGLTIRESNEKHSFGALILAIHKEDGQFDTKPSADTLLYAGQKLIVIGTKEQLDTLERLVR